MTGQQIRNRRWFLKTASFALASSASLAYGHSPFISKVKAEEKQALNKADNSKEITPNARLPLDQIGVHLPLWHQGSLDKDKFWNEVFTDLTAHKIFHCTILNYYFVDPVLGNISKTSQFNNNKAPDLEFLSHGMKVARDFGVKASLYTVLEIDNPHQIGGIWRGNLNFFGRTLETFFQQYINLILKVADLSLTYHAPSFFIGSELASLSHNIAARPLWEEMIYRLQQTQKSKPSPHRLSLCYAAHWEEYLSFPFWRQMDVIGINGYFPLSTAVASQPIGAPSQAHIRKSISSKFKELQRFSAEHGRPIHLTEFGLTPYNQTLATPWGKPQGQQVDLIEQENGYRALLDEIKQADNDWMKGVSFWHWKLPHRFGSDYNIRPYGPLAKLLKN